MVGIEGLQVEDLNFWNAHDLNACFQRQDLCPKSTHVSVGNRLWSNRLSFCLTVTITHETLSWYGWDEDGGGVHAVIGTRCDP